MGMTMTQKYWRRIPDRIGWNRDSSSWRIWTWSWKRYHNAGSHKEFEKSIQRLYLIKKGCHCSDHLPQ